MPTGWEPREPMTALVRPIDDGIGAKGVRVMTEINPGTVRAAGESYGTVADTLGAAAGRLRGATARPDDFGRGYRSDGEAYGSALDSLARAVDVWRDGARAVGGGLVESAAAHSNTDTGGGNAIAGAGDGR